MAVDASRNLFIADQDNNRIREVGFAGATLVLNNVSAANAGSYDVVVSSPYGSVKSSVVTLQVLVPPASAHNSKYMDCGGKSAYLRVAASGTAPLDYQWYLTARRSQGQSGVTLFLNSVSYTNAGSYGVVVTDLYGSVTSMVAVVTVGIAPSITEQPVRQTNLVQTTASFSVAVSGTGPLTYQWQFNGSIFLQASSPPWRATGQRAIPATAARRPKRS